ncbi:hypothetical protein FN846DRAFT_963782 [Sphaerosporella brunnea]|uniref:Phosphotransferase n=1 Tax=Sphaerosporella brunnea TaxID=1250544 RepID=A0A5J5ENP4_9PEZI|nr:hypothetical protein FN846DRAFT_963782 [Sphaerosporella brunnea]
MSSSQLLASLEPPSIEQLRVLSDTLLSSIKSNLRDPNGTTMLPSYIHRLPNGQERGTALGVDLGGSTLRVAVIQLSGQGGGGSGSGIVDVLVRKSWSVTDDVKQLHGSAFFDWVAEKIEVVIAKANLRGTPLRVGLTWSFPIVQTSPESGTVQKMGKGFRTHEGIEGTELRIHFENALRRKNLRHVYLASIVNDTTATLLTHAYSHPQARISLICGTGVNAAVLVPVTCLAVEKLGRRPSSWTSVARNVVVNTECSMLGAGIFPTTSADSKLDSLSDKPGFQPFEQLTSGRYLGEVVRLNLEAAGLKLVDRWSLSTEMIAQLESADIDSAAIRAFKSTFGIDLEPSEVDFVSSICRAVARRAAAYIAVMVYAFHRLQCGELEGEQIRLASVACCGAVIEKHPTLRSQCQEFLDALEGQRKITLDIAHDSGLVGAGVAVLSSLEQDKESAKL